MEAKRAKNGWRDEETALLFNAVQGAAERGRPLRDVFSEVGQRLGRKPNSIRNYYYARVRELPHHEGRKAPFQTFTSQELEALLREVLVARGEGISVRACVMRMADGDKQKMLRYQNKYRAILKNRPDMLERVAEDLRREGLPCPRAAERRAMEREESENRVASLYQTALTLSLQTGDRTLETLLEALNGLLRRAVAPQRLEEVRREADRLAVQNDLLRMQAEDDRDQRRAAVAPLLNTLREFLALPPERRELDDFLKSVSECLGQAEAGL